MFSAKTLLRKGTFVLSLSLLPLALAGCPWSPTFTPNFLEEDVLVGNTTPPVFAPVVSCEGLNVYVTWKSGLGYSKIYFNRSIDGGLTWLADDIRLDSGTGVSNSPQMVCSGSNVYVVWTDTKYGNFDVYFNRSTDGGTTWLPSEKRIDHAPPSAFSYTPQIACSEESVFVVWVDSRNGPKDIYFNRSLDAGSTWMPGDVRLDSNTPSNGSSIKPQFWRTGVFLYVVWQDARYGDDRIYFNRSSNGGATWLASDVRLDSAYQGTCTNPQVRGMGQDVYVVWEDTRGISSDIYFRRSSNGGVSWNESDFKLNTGPNGFDALQPRLDCSGENVYVVWYEDRWGTLNDVYFRRSLNRGADWLSTDTPIDLHPYYSSPSNNIEMSCSGTNVYVVYRDERHGGQFKGDIYFNYSTDGGATWTPEDRRLNTDPPGSANSIAPVIASDDDKVYVIWSDHRNGVLDLYFNRSIPAD